MSSQVIKKGVVLSVIVAVSMIFLATLSVYAQTAATSTAPAAPAEPVLSAQEIERQSLEAEIRRKNNDLDAIKKAIEKNEEALSKTQGEKATLQRDITVLKRQKDSLVKQIQGDETNLKLLDLEIKSLTFDLQDIESGISDRKKAMQEVLKKIQRGDSVSPLAVLLKNDSLADGVLELKNLSDLNARITLDIQNLRKLNQEYSTKIETLTAKHEEVEIRSSNLKNRKAILTDQEVRQQALLKETKEQESVYQRHLQEIYERQKEIAAEVEALDAKLRGQIDYAGLPSGKIFGYPVEGGKITQGYGATSFAQSGYRGKWHNGLDFRAVLGTPIVAVTEGKIEATGDQDRYCPRGAYGKFVVVKHPNNVTTLYGHLSRITVSTGDTVKRGQVIGYSGATGYATGPHLHFTVFASPTFKMAGSRSCGPMPQGGDLNPLNYL